LKANVAAEIDSLIKQIAGLERLAQYPDQVEAVLLQTCGGLLEILNHLQNGYHSSPQSGDNQAQPQTEVQQLLASLESYRQNLEESEVRYQSVVESLVELVCRFTPDGALTFYNQAFERYFSALGVVATGVRLSDLIPKDTRSFTNHFTATLHPSLPSADFEYRIQTPEGETQWQHWTGLGIFDEAGRLVEIQAVGHDITERKLAEIAISQQTRELSALHNATTALLSTLDPQALLGRILDAAISAIPAARKGTLHLIVQETGQLEMRASVGYSDPRIRRIHIPGSVGYVVRAVREHTPLLISDLHSDPSNLVGQLSAGRDVRSVIVAPLAVKGHVLGAISLESTRVGAFNESDLRLLSSFAATATVALNNARLHEEMQKLAITDALTGLYNRRGFFELGQREVERSRRFNRALVAIMMDVDRFKFINDLYGHPVGDRVLQAVAKRCAENLRRIDLLGRFGGDEFTLLLPETDIYRARGVAERLRHAVAVEPVETDRGLVEVTVSLGIARATSSTPDLEVLIGRADAAMYLAKQAGRNRVEFG
jgi:diguanylate cyclase (GGDEF)-like protein/PAS domain S-box-containing protein